MESTFKPLQAEILPDFFHFFDHVGFSDNPDWASCYCCYFHIACTEKEWTKRTREENRKYAERSILSGDMKGYLAYRNGLPVGWCNANDKAMLGRLTADRDLLDSRGEKVGSVVCFVIAPSFRKQGIARQLLEEACTGFKNLNYGFVEAYPRKKGSSDAQHYHGPLSMYQKAGFFIHKEFPEYFVVRKEL